MDLLWKARGLRHGQLGNRHEDASWIEHRWIRGNRKSQAEWRLAIAASVSEISDSGCLSDLRSVKASQLPLARVTCLRTLLGAKLPWPVRGQATFGVHCRTLSVRNDAGVWLLTQWNQLTHRPLASSMSSRVPMRAYNRCTARLTPKLAAGVMLWARRG